MKSTYLGKKGDIAETLDKRFPNIWKDCYPRRIIPPQGYPNPLRHSEIVCSLFADLDAEDYSTCVHQAMMFTSVSLIEKRFPTYFVDQNLCKALAETDIPDINFGEIRWPIDPILLVFPKDFSQSFFGFPVGFLSLAKIDAGQYPKKDFLDKCRKSGWERTFPAGVESRMTGFSFHFTLCGETIFDDIEYGGIFPSDISIQALLGMSLVGRFTETYRHFSAEEIEERKKVTIGPRTEINDRILQNRVLSFGIRVLMAMASRPRLVEHGQCIRPAKVKKNKSVDELWSPNVVGRLYRIKDQSGNSIDIRSSPRFHFRSGHFRFQAFGSRKDGFISVNELPRTPEGAIDWQNIPEQTRRKFYETHEYKWIDTVAICPELTTSPTSGK